MIHYINSNLLESRAEALVNTVNTVGIMGKGIALQFKNQFPENYKSYKNACKSGEIRIGKLFITKEASILGGEKIIINFPTKTDWRKPSEYSYIEEGLKELVQVIQEKNISSIAIPPLGAGNGGLKWDKVKVLIEAYLSDIDSEIYIYQPDTVIQEALKKERVKLTPARAMLLAVLFDLVKNGEFVSEFSAEKIAYFLQRFGAKDIFKLDFKPNFYGPYSGKVKHVLHYLNGSYISGYSAKDKKPFDELGLMMDAENEVDEYLNNVIDYKDVVLKTKAFLSGFYADFGLELLSTIDFIMINEKTKSVIEITKHLENWSDRKKTMFTNPKFITIAIENIEKNLS